MGGLSFPDRRDIDAVVFDAGGVLLLPDAEAGRAAIATLDCESTPEDWRRAHYATLSLLDQMQTIDWLAHRRAVAAEIGVPDDSLDAAAALIDNVMAGNAWVAVPGAADALRALSGAGYNLAVVSNAWGTVAQWLKQHGVCSVEGGDLPQVAAVIDSHLVGVEKPDPRIFQLAIDALGVPPARSIYVGDTLKFDVDGAYSAGLHPVHVDPYDFCDGSHRHIVELAELTSWLVDGEPPRAAQAEAEGKGEMAFDEDLADRTRAALSAARATTTEKKMFGGLAFMIGGNMCCGVMGEDLLVRVGADANDAALADPAARPFEMGQRGPSAGFILVGPGGTDTEKDLAAWVSRALTFNATLPAKKAK